MPDAGSDWFTRWRDRLDERWWSVFIALAGLILLSRCIGATFLPYDDPIHIHANPLVFGKGTLADVFIPRVNSTYMPITTLTYRADHLLFAEWMTAAFGSWAPGIRLVTWLYHSLAAIILWRLLLRLGAGRGSALIVALIFAVHPTACETVCWVSERKNALAAMFGFASLYAFVRWDGSAWRLPLTAGWYALACLSKPSALGFLPVLVGWELLGGAGALQQAAPSSQTKPRKQAVIILALLALVSAAVVALDVQGHQTTLMPPPGGTLLTAALTDTEVLSRYFYNLLVPVDLSFAYFVEPITSVGDVRLVLCLSLLAATVALTIWLAANRRLAAFGWVWFFGALTPSLNFVSIPQIMQDRYIYLSLPGFFLALTEAVRGLSARIAALRPRVIALAAGAYVLALALLSLTRGELFSNQFSLFSDAVRKQPHAAHARYGLAVAYAQVYEVVKNTPVHSDGQRSERDARLAELRKKVGELDRAFIDQCPDATRQINFDAKACNAGTYALELGQLDEAQRYFGLVLNPPPHLRILPNYRATALERLSRVRLKRGAPQEAFDLAEQAVKLAAALPGGIQSDAFFARGQAALALAEAIGDRDAAQAKTLRDLAGSDLRAVQPQAPDYDEAQRLLRK
jgi:tetratricopeptide (TPR) repeat protein